MAGNELQLPPTEQAASNSEILIVGVSNLVEDFTPPLIVDGSYNPSTGGGSQNPSTDSGSQNPSIGGSQDSDTTFVSSQEKRDKRKDIFNKLMSECGLDVQLDHLLTVSVAEASSSTINSKVKAAKAGFTAVLMTICKDSDEIGPLMAKCQESNVFSAIISETSGQYFQEPYFRELMKLWQNTTSYSKLVEITSLLTQFYTMEHLLKFNRPENVNGPVYGVDNQQVLFFEPRKMTKHLFTKGRSHYKQNGMPMVPKISPKYHRRHFGPEVILAIIRFATSPEIHQNVAYGTIYDR